MVVDASNSITTTSPSDNFTRSEWTKEKEFAKSLVAAFADRNLFENGGTASYVQFHSVVQSFGSFTSLEEFNDFVDRDEKGIGGTNIDVGMAKANSLLAANASTATYMFVITDGNGIVGDAPANALAAGTSIFVVGVGEVEKARGKRLKHKNVMGVCAHHL